MKTIAEIWALIKEFEKTSLTALEIELDGVKVKMEKASENTRNETVDKPVVSDKPVNALQECQPGTIVKSPLVGTFYASASPTENPFVKVGKMVAKGDTLCIIEAMKTMNEIKAPVAGKISKIHVKNGDYVGFDQALVSIEHDE